jgi:hypothetical protein
MSELSHFASCARDMLASGQVETPPRQTSLTSGGPSASRRRAAYSPGSIVIRRLPLGAAA